MLQRQTAKDSAVRGESHWLFKEWAAVCAAIAAGRQTVLLRKGGIQERGEIFEPDHRAFWLLPTRFHQSPEELTSDATELIARGNELRPVDNRLRLRTFALIEEIWWIEREETLPALRGWHILSDATVRQRFHYRRPGLFALLVRAGSVETPFEVEDRPEYAGCKTWVELESALSGELSLAVGDEEFELTRQRWDGLRRQEGMTR